MEKNHTKEVEKLREQIDRSRQTHSKEDSDLKRKVRELQEEIKVVEIDRRNFLSSRGNQEAEKTALLRERDALMQKLHDTEIHQLANKYKLDKVADLIIDLEARVRYSSTEDAEKKGIEHGLQQTLEKLESVREDMAKTRELGKILDGDTVSVSSFKSVGSTFSRKNSTDIDKALPWTDQRPVPIGSEAEPPTHSKNGSLSATATPRTQRKDGPGEVNSSQIFKSSSSSACSEVTIHNWEQRITEIRLRSPSPSPRKMTNYPEAPPSIILSKEKSVEYDKDGKRHWIPNTMQRSISHDPRTSMSLATPDDASSLASGISSATDSEVIKSRNRSQSSGTGKMLRAQVSTESADSQPAPHTEQTGRFANIFGTLGRSGGHVNEKGKFFSLRKSKSVETSSTARNLAGVGMQAMSPGVSPSVLPDSLQSSVGSGINVDIGSSEQIHTSRGKKLVERLRRFRSRSRSKEPTASIQNLPAKTDTAVSAPSTPVIPATTILDSSRSKPSVSTVGRTWSTESESRRIDSQVSSDRKAANSPAKQLENDTSPLKEKCVRQEKVINDLREQLQLAKHDKDTAEQKCNVATERLLQAEERWNKELEKLRESYENQVKDLKYYLKEAVRSKDEKSSLLTECTNTLNDKTKRVNELEQKVSRLQDDLKNKYRDLQDKMEVEHKRAKEFETKYQKLEELYESDQQKLNTDRDKLKSEISEFKKRYDDGQEDMEKMRKSREKQEQEWGRERKDLESKISKLEAHQSEVEQRMSQKAAETASVKTKKLMAEVNELKSKSEKDMEQAKKEKQELQNQVDQKTEALEERMEDESKLKREVELLKERVEEQKTQLQETRNVRDTSREELSRWQQTWARERSDLAHKLRQEEKIQQAEIQALRLKFESRIKIMEDTTKTLHAQLAQARRERDKHRDSLLNSEKKLAELKQKMENTDTAMILRLSNAEEKLEEYDDLKTQLQRLQQENKIMSQNYETDIQMWAIEKKELNSKLPEIQKESATKPGTIRSGRFDRPELSPLKKKQQEKDKSTDTDRVADAMKIAEKLRKQIDEMEKNHTKEVEKLREQIDRSRQTHSKEDSDLKRKVRELQEEIKVVEIDRRNFLSSRGNQEAEKTAWLRERDALMQKLHDTEIHQLANKYKLDKVADLIIDLEARVRYSSTEDAEKKEIQRGLQQT